jgi:hypothetical protein
MNEEKKRLHMSRKEEKKGEERDRFLKDRAREREGDFCILSEKDVVRYQERQE